MVELQPCSQIMNDIKVDKYPGGFGSLCVGCGACCRRMNVAVKAIPTYSEKYNIPIEELDFPYKYDETGRCENLGEDNLCKVYENRPNFCNVDWMMDKMGMTDNKNNFYELNAKACNQMMDEDNIDPILRINI